MRATQDGRFPASVVVAGAVMGLFLTAPPAAEAQSDYDFVLVEAFNITYDLREVYLRDINELGVACGTSTYESSYAGFVWTESDDKTLIPITWTRGLNNLGQVVGDNRIYDTGTGQSTIVPPAGGWPLTRLMGINDNGVVVGFAECACSNSDGVLQSALIWDPQNGSRTTGILAARELLRINEGNVAVGNIRPSAGSSEAFVYDVDTGAYTNLSDLLPDPPSGRPRSEGADINAGGAVCGQAYDGTTVRGMVWSPDDGFTYLPGLEGGDPMRVHPMGMNDAGVVVGRALSGASGDWDGFIWDPVNGMRNLDQMMDAPGAFTTDWAVEISENGWIVGIGHFGPGWGTARGFVLKPRGLVEVPSTASAGLELRLSPNPVTTRIEVEWSGPSTSRGRLSIFDPLGRLVRTVPVGPLSGGRHTFRVDGADLVPGIYFVRLEAGDRSVSRQIVRVP